MYVPCLLISHVHACHVYAYIILLACLDQITRDIFLALYVKLAISSLIGCTCMSTSHSRYASLGSHVYVYLLLLRSCFLYLYVKNSEFSLWQTSCTPDQIPCTRLLHQLHVSRIFLDQTIINGQIYVNWPHTHGFLNSQS